MTDVEAIRLSRLLNTMWEAATLLNEEPVTGGHAQILESHDLRLTELEMPQQYATQYDQDAEPPTFAYLGNALPGTATSAAAWRIQKLTFGSDGDVTAKWADGNANFDNAWDNRASLTYT